MTVRRGEIYYIENNLATVTVGSEQRSGRPGIIVSNDKGNEHSEHVEVVYLTTKDKTPLPTHVKIMASVPSTALCEQVHSVDKSRIKEHLRDCTEEEMKEIDNALLISLGLNVTETESKALSPFKLTSEQMLDVVKVETEKNIYKNLYESLLDVVLFKKVTG